MKRVMVTAGLALAVSAATIYAAPASAHGCHADWQLSIREGWHNHGKRCEPRQGIGLGYRWTVERKHGRALSHAPIWRGYPQSR
jgi:hypothetical protein